MKPVVIDASMAVTWTFPDEWSDLGETILTEARRIRRITTPLFWYEYRNILVTNALRKRFERADIPILLEEAKRLEIESIELFDHEKIINLALHYRLTAYDASYLALAVQEHAILATNDKQLAQAAFSEGVELRTSLLTQK